MCEHAFRDINLCIKILNFSCNWIEQRIKRWQSTRKIYL